MVVVVRKLIWRRENVKHIQKHSVTAEELVELIGNFHIEKAASKKRLILIGETDSARVLAIVLESKGNGRYYPVTAYDASSEEVALFRRKKEVSKR